MALKIVCDIGFENKDNTTIIGVFPKKTYTTDSGFDICIPLRSKSIKILPKQFTTINTLVKFKLELPFYLKFLHWFGIGIHANIQPKSGRSKNGLEVSLGEIDEDYRGYVGVTLYNRTNKAIILNAGEKIAQITFNIIFNRVQLVYNKFRSDETQRGEKGFGSTGI
jgi:dUTP pyrophosphatase